MIFGILFITVLVIWPFLAGIGAQKYTTIKNIRTKVTVLGISVGLISTLVTFLLAQLYFRPLGKCLLAMKEPEMSQCTALAGSFVRWSKDWNFMIFNAFGFMTILIWLYINRSKT